MKHYRSHRLLRSARRVGVYLSMGAELDTGPLIAALHAAGVAVYAPRIGRNGQLRFLPLTRSRLRRSPLGMQQPPPGPAIPLRRLQLLLLPLLGFDAEGGRLGQGGGYYDRSCAGLRGARRPLRTGLAYACQQVARIPCESHDRPLHAVLTERGLKRFPHRP